MNPKDVVRVGYDRISYEYRDDEGRGPVRSGEEIRAKRTAYLDWVAELTLLLRAYGQVLDLGCGCGVPVARILAERFHITGVDFSSVQIERARKLAPKATFICADMSEVDFPAERFDAIISLFAIIHLPLAEQPSLFANIRRWLKPGGYLLATVGHRAWTGTEENWLGAEMYWSHADEATYLTWLRDLAFRILWTRFLPEGDSGHTLLLAQRT
jgi:cyclopropane fatty-acyl-phospholipid synthase-like methyltransferase